MIEREHVAERLGVDYGPTLVYPDRTLYRHRPAVLKYLGRGTRMAGSDEPGITRILFSPNERDLAYRIAVYEW